MIINHYADYRRWQKPRKPVLTKEMRGRSLGNSITTVHERLLQSEKEIVKLKEENDYLIKMLKLK